MIDKDIDMNEETAEMFDILNGIITTKNKMAQAVLDAVLDRSQKAVHIVLLANRYKKEISASELRELLACFNNYCTLEVILMLNLMARKLGSFPPIEMVMAELREQDGRPSPQTAVSMISWDSSRSFMCTDEMLAAFERVIHILKDDIVGARNMFMALYEKEIMRARELRQPVNWHLIEAPKNKP